MGTWKMIALEIGVLGVLIASIFAAVPVFRVISASLNSDGLINETASANSVPTPLISVAPTPTPSLPTAAPPNFSIPSFIPTQPAATNDENNPRAAGAIAFFYGVSTEGINSWRDRGFTYADIIRGYTLARMSGKSPKDIFPMKSSGVTWDQIEKNLCGSTGHAVPTLADILGGRARKPKAECAPNDQGD